jgi:hypothetical protein
MGDVRNAYAILRVIVPVSKLNTGMAGARHQNGGYAYTKNDTEHQTGRETWNWKTQLEMVR